MRLTSIKLAGFKSFVDPTHFQVPGQLVGVVGPNGCGKSNIIDAVRWVLGESRASELRGESMQDVIFNGSTSRKPGSRASVELVFANSGGRAAGQWSQYAEIAVKRVLTRDGTSSYYINNLPARRRDIQDIFLGTGLGPRAYAIIGQGMIARIIEARPEDLRVFLEEAAGVSKYKERRRETENRLHDTRENLTRVEDIVRELAGNLDKLEAQAVLAERFGRLRSEGDEKQRLLWLMRRNEARQEQERQQHAIEAARFDLEARLARLREIEAELENVRMAHDAASDMLQARQGALYEANSEVSRIEAELRYIAETRARAQTQIAALEVEHGTWRARAQDARADLANTEASHARAEEAAWGVEQTAAIQSEKLPALDARAREIQAALAQTRFAHAGAQHAVKLEAAQQRNAGHVLQQLRQRRERLEAEAAGLVAPDTARLDEARAELAEGEGELAELARRGAALDASLASLDQARRAAQARHHEARALTHRLDARLAALRQLQERVQTEGKVEPWLAHHQLASLPRLWNRVAIEPGWETALEAVLRERLNAVELSDLASVERLAADAPPAKLAVYALPPAAQPVAAPAGLRPLLELLRIDDPGLRGVLSDWLGATFVAADLPQALAVRGALPDGAALVVPQGHLISRVGIQFYAADSEQAGVLARQHEIANLSRQVRAQALLAEAAEHDADAAEARYRAAQDQATSVRGQAQQARQRVHGLQLEVLQLTQGQERYRQRTAQICDELNEIQVQAEEQRVLSTEACDRGARREQDLAVLEARVRDEQAAWEALDAELGQARQSARALERAAQERRFEARDLARRGEELRRVIDDADGQQKRLAEALEQARAELDALDATHADRALQAALETRSACERTLTDARAELDASSARLRWADEERLSTERSVQPLRERITEFQLQEQAARLSREQFAEQLRAADANEAALTAKLVPDLKPGYLQSEITRINQAIDALGPVNLAALEELSAARERKQFLDAQSTDLRDAIGTLEDAIRKIDHETRALLQGTFDEVNGHFGELFPRLFGGGQARLVMTGDELLDAGVQVMAQPPGKKNSTIHLLSGGEKALAATALVFAMFQLNPAPFCLLDEVDAPLDDVNTERFANLVRAMSDKTQFLFISHNKIAMEMAQQLIGVTMQEQGVSRIVAVSLESAARFAHNGA